jgi:hypothetical protein
MPPCVPHLTPLATGSLERSLLVFSTPVPRTEASSATTFRSCSSPAPTPVMPQPSPAILSQESIHTTLSITHHTRKRPSTGPRTTHGPQPSDLTTRSTSSFSGWRAKIFSLYDCFLIGRFVIIYIYIVASPQARRIRRGSRLLGSRVSSTCQPPVGKNRLIMNNLDLILRKSILTKNDANTQHK